METPPTLARLAQQLAEHAGILAEQADHPLSTPDRLEMTARARDAELLANQLLSLCIDQARDAGHTWQEVGDLLGVTRQAAFQRFGKPIDPRTGEPMDKTVHMTDAAERARVIAQAVLDGRMDEARPHFNAQVLAAFTDEVRGEGLATVAGMVGAFEGFGEGDPFVRRIGDHTVVDLPLRYEAGEMKARVSFGTDEQVAGLYILTPETP